jgi:hypothetical protein
MLTKADIERAKLQPKALTTSIGAGLKRPAPRRPPRHGRNAEHASGHQDEFESRIHHRCSANAEKSGTNRRPNVSGKEKPAIHSESGYMSRRPAPITSGGGNQEGRHRPRSETTPAPFDLTLVRDKSCLTNATPQAGTMQSPPIGSYRERMLAIKPGDSPF